MNFQDLKKIEPAEFYLDVAFRKASKRISETKSTVRAKDSVSKAKQIETSRIEQVKSNLVDNLTKILVSFPVIDDLDDFYKELINCTLDYKSLKKSLGSVNWALQKIDYFFKFYKNKIKRCYEYSLVLAAKKEFYGRISSVLKQINPYLAYLEESRKTMRDYPAVKTSVFTVCVFGFPNVGKSTLLSKLTTARPEINSYPFTTKKLNLGYIREPPYTVQVIDTPGTLNRMDKMNNIELQAYLVVKHLADIIVYVFDPTFEYSQKDQDKLLSEVRKKDKPVMLFMSKADVADEKTIQDFKEKYPDIITSSEELKKRLLENSKKKLI